MFLSRMSLDMSHEDTQNLIRSPHAQREMVYGAFPPNSRGILWRVDSLEGRLWIVILSRLRPDLNEFHHEYGFQGVFPSWEILDYDSALEELDLRYSLSFELCACPFASVNFPRDYLQDLSFLRAYLVDQGLHGGFDIENISSLTSYWKMIDNRYTMFAWWKGKLHITNLELFLEMTKNGIGHNPHLGAGLLTVSVTNDF